MEFEIISEIVKETVNKFVNVEEILDLESYFKKQKVNLNDLFSKIK
jgi:hypothetical protein